MSGQRNTIGALKPINSAQKASPKSMMGIKTSGNARFLQSAKSIDSDNTITAFLAKDSNGTMVKTKQMLERQEARVAKVKRARENAVANAMEKSAKLTLKERRYESNTKRHIKAMQDEEHYRADMFSTIQ